MGQLARFSDRGVAARRTRASTQPPLDSSSQKRLAILAAAGEPRREHWQRRFQCLLASRAISALSGGEVPDIDAGALAGQFGLRFRKVPADRGGFSASIAFIAQRVAPLLSAGRKVCVDLTPVPGDTFEPANGESGFAAFCAALQVHLPSFFGSAKPRPGQLMFSLLADHPGLPAFLKLREIDALACPYLGIRIPNRMMSRLRFGTGETNGGDSACAENPDSIWERLTRTSHQDPGVVLIPAATTLPLSDLHSSERCEVAMPQSLFEAPADSAWLALQLDVSRLADPVAGIGFRRLRPILRAGLRFADNLVDCVEWPWASLRLDAMLNRRVAVHLVGIGDLVDKLDLDPLDFRSLQLVARWLGLMKRVLIRESAALARRRGPFPGLGVNDLVRNLAPHYGLKDAERLIRQHSLRHRHLLAISPWAIFPSSASKHPTIEYCNLLPAISCADTINMYGDHKRHGLPLRHYRQLMRMTWALSRNRR
ncbi:MAG: hypothetical protein V3R53_00860 [Gammaproteobacteria bacterium]